MEYKRYMLFYYHDYEGSGGINDCQFSSYSIEDCIKELNKEAINNKSNAEWYRNFHIFDREEGTLIEQQEIVEKFDF